MWIMKTLINTLFLAGSLILSSCENKELKEETKTASITPLDKFNLENKNIYNDFSEFIRNNPNKIKYNKNQYQIKELGINFTENRDTLIYLDVQTEKNSPITFSDNESNGLDEKFVDSYTFKEKESNLIKTFLIKDFSPEKQLEIAKEYTELIKKIMHESKYRY